VQGALGVSERRACRTLGQPRSTQRRPRRIRDDEAALTEAIVTLAAEYGRYGYRRITAMLRTQGWRVNAKRVQRIWRREGLKVTAAAAEAWSSVAERRLLHPAAAVLAGACLGV
jgi:putative transposase